jgi:hypothetical protein
MSGCTFDDAVAQDLGQQRPGVARVGPRAVAGAADAAPIDAGRGPGRDARGQEGEGRAPIAHEPRHGLSRGEEEGTGRDPGVPAQETPAGREDPDEREPHALGDRGFVGDGPGEGGVVDEPRVHRHLHVLAEEKPCGVVRVGIRLRVERAVLA